MNPSANNFFISIAKGDVQYSQKDQNDALRWACLHGNLEIFDLLIEKGADVNSVDEFGASMLHFAIKGEKQQIIIRLLDCNIRFEEFQQGGETLLLLACRCQFLNVVRKLIQLDAQCVHRDVDSVGRKALHMACLSESFSVVELLINQPNFDVNQLDENGWTGLHYVCSTKSLNQCNLMHLLFMRNADPLIETPTGKTALEMASECGIIKHIIDILPVKKILEILVDFDSLRPPPRKTTTRESHIETERATTPHVDENALDGSNVDDMLVMYWKRIINNEDIELLNHLIETGVWSVEIEVRNARRSVVLESNMKALFEDCYDNGLGIHTYVRVNFEDEIKQEDFQSILLELSDLERFSALNYESCILFEDLSENMVLLALLCGRLNLVQHLLINRQFDIIPLGLIVIIICRKFEQECHFPKQVKDKLDCFSDTIESLVVDAINNTFLVDSSNSKNISLNMLDLPLKSFGKISLLDLADKAQCNRVLSLACCQIVLDKRWYGVLTFMSLRWRLAAIVMPLLFWFYQIYASQKKMLSEDVSGRKRGRLLNSSTFHKGRLDYFNEYGDSRGIQPIMRFLQAPAVIFHYHSLLQLMFLILFSYVMIYDFHFRITTMEVICYSYIIGYAMEEVKQCVLISLRQSFVKYKRDNRNMLDILFLLFMFAGITMRLFCIGKDSKSIELEARDTLLYCCRVVFLSGLLVFYFRALFLLSIYRVLGPKLKMIYSMVGKDLVPFMALFLLFLIAFGVVFEGLTNPNNLKYNSTLDSVLGIYSTGFYGSFSTEYFTQNVKECAVDNNDCTHQLGSQLVFYFYNIIYVIVVNIMLLSLLIALFSNTVSRIDQESTTNWFADRYKKVEEYRGRSILPPPFNILCIATKLISQLGKLIFNVVSRARQNSTFSSSGRENAIVAFFIMQAFALKNRRGTLGGAPADASNPTDRAHDADRQKYLTSESLSLRLDELNDKLNRLLDCTQTKSETRKDRRLLRTRDSMANRISVIKRVTQKVLPSFMDIRNGEGESVPLHEIKDETLQISN